MMVTVQYLIILTAVETIIYIFHASILLLLISKRKTTFKGAFYDIFRIVIVADLATFALLVIAFRVPLLSVDFFKNDNYIPSADLLISAYFLVVEFIGHTLMAFNRFTIFWFPLRHDRIWSRNWYIIALIVLPFGHVCYRLTEHGIFSFSSGNTVAMIYTNPAMTSLIFLLSAAIFLITTIFAAIFNGLSLIKFYFYKQTSNSVSVKDKRLLFLNCIIFVAQVLRTSYSLSRQIFASNESMIAFLIAALPYITDAFAWAGSISLLLLSPTVRRAYVGFYFCNSAIGISSTSVPPVTITNRKQMTKILN